MELICDTEPVDIVARKVKNKSDICLKFGEDFKLGLERGQAHKIYTELSDYFEVG